MSSNNYEFSAKVWLYPGNAAWHFLSVPTALSKEISARYSLIKRGFGSLPVTACIGQTSWQTSIFPDSQSGCYLLPLKSEVRKKEKIEAGELVHLSIEVRT